MPGPVPDGRSLRFGGHRGHHLRFELVARPAQAPGDGAGQGGFHRAGRLEILAVQGGLGGDQDPEVAQQLPAAATVTAG